MGSLIGFFAGGPARIQALVIGAIAVFVVAMGLVTWALIERTWRLQDKVELVTVRGQNQVLENSLKICNAGAASAASAGQAALADVKRLLGMAETAMLKTAALREEARAIVSTPAPVRPDGKPKDCADAWAEIRRKVQP